jgi:hypothetical protein
VGPKTPSSGTAIALFAAAGYRTSVAFNVTPDGLINSLGFIDIPGCGDA